MIYKQGGQGAKLEKSECVARLVVIVNKEHKGKHKSRMNERDQEENVRPRKRGFSWTSEKRRMPFLLLLATMKNNCANESEEGRGNAQQTHSTPQRNLCCERNLPRSFMFGPSIRVGNFRKVCSRAGSRSQHVFRHSSKALTLLDCSQDDDQMRTQTY